LECSFGAADNSREAHPIGQSHASDSSPDTKGGPRGFGLAIEDGNWETDSILEDCAGDSSPDAERGWRHGFGLDIEDDDWETDPILEADLADQGQCSSPGRPGPSRSSPLPRAGDLQDGDLEVDSTDRWPGRPGRPGWSRCGGPLPDGWVFEDDDWEAPRPTGEGRSHGASPPGPSDCGGCAPDPEPSGMLCLPGSDEPSTAPPLLPGESHAQRAARLLADNFGMDGCPAPATRGTSSAVLVEEGMQKLGRGEAAGARMLFAQAVLADATDPEALFSLGLYFEVAHQPERMVRWMDAAIERLPGHALAWVLRSKHMEHQGLLETALRGYEHALRLQPDNSMALSARRSLLAHRGVHVEPVSSWGLGVAEAILASKAGGAQQLPAWQENFLRPAAAPPLRQPLLSEGVMAWDDVLSDELLAQLDVAVEQYFHFTFSNGWMRGEGGGPGGGGAAATCWLPAGAAPATAPEVAARAILKQVLKEDPSEFSGIEYWGRVRSVNLGADLHYDQAEAATDDAGDWAHGNPWRPQWSTVLYLTDEGGPTVILDQIHRESGRHVPFIPQRGHLCVPKRNRLVVFRADLFHGTLPVNVWLDTAEKRRVFVFNFWRRHRPEAPHCQRPDFDRHTAMRRLVLKPPELQRLLAAEAKPREAALPVQRRRFCRREELPQCSDFRYLQAAMPMPRMDQLLGAAGLCEVDWAAAAASCGEPDGDGASGPAGQT